MSIVDKVKKRATRKKRAVVKRGKRKPVGKKSKKSLQDRFGADRPLVDPNDMYAKSGCFYCPLLVWSDDFDEKLAQRYEKDSDQIEKIRAKEPDGHEVHNRCVSEEWTEVDILCVGEAPGGQEDRSGKPFVGRSGKLLRDAITEMADTPEERIGYTNVVRCQPPRNKKPNKTEVKCCIGKLVAEIKARKPKVLVALGNTPLEALTGNTGIMTFHKSVQDCTLPGFEHLKVVGCFHPAYVLRMDHMIDSFCEALAIPGEIAKGEFEALPGPGTYEVLTDLDIIEELLSAFKLDGEEGYPVAFDTETGDLSPFVTHQPQLLCISLSNEAGYGFTIPYDHRDSPFQDWYDTPGPQASEKERLREMLADFFASDCPKIAQNERFDRQHLFHALGVYPENVVRDTMLMHHALDERQGTHGLKSLAFKYTGMGGYEKPLEEYVKAHKEANPKRDGSYAEIPGSLLFEYAAMDADVTIRVDEGLQEEDEYENEKLQVLAEHFYPALSDALASIEYAGAQIDGPVVAYLDRKYRAEMEEYERQIHNLPVVRQFTVDQIKKGKTGKRKADPFVFNPGSTQQLRKVLFDYYELPPLQLTETGFDKMLYRLKRRTDKAKREGTKPPDYDTLLRHAVHKKEWDLFTTKAEVLHEYAGMGNELAPLILEYRARSTLHGTFIKPLMTMLDSEGRVHGSFMPFGTVTGRLSSSDPNLQNIPNKGGGLVKRCYTSRFGDEGVLLQLDYSQVELRIAACWYNEPEMIRAYKNQEDLHTLTAIAISGLSREKYEALDDAAQKEWRTRAKRINFGCVPMDTRALTRDGWKDYDSLHVGDEVLGYRNGKLVWTPVREKVRYETAPVVELSNSNFKARVTADHRWIGEKRIDRGNGGRGYEPTAFRTREIGPEHRVRLSAPVESEDVSGLTESEAEIIGWLFTDGHVYRAPATGARQQAGGSKRKTDLNIYQSELTNADKVRHIDDLLASVPHSRYVRDTGIVHWKLRTDYARRLWESAGLDTLSLEQLVLRFGTRQRRAFLRAAIMAEGHVDNRRPGSQFVSQNTGPVLDALRTAVFMDGYYPRESVKGVHRGNECRAVRFGKPTVTGQRLTVKDSGETGPVWCIVTDCDSWVMRQDDRVMLTGNCLYGGGAAALQRTLKQDGIEVTKNEAQKLLEKFFKARPKLKRALEKLKAETTKRGYLESFTGRRRRIPAVFSEDEEIRARALRQSINFPIQSGASDMTLMSLILIQRMLRESDYVSEMVLSVHDSIIIDCHVDEVFEIAERSVEIMESLPELSDEVWPGLDWTWLTCPIVADAEMGVSWGQLIGFDPRDYDIDEVWGRLEEKAALPLE